MARNSGANSYGDSGMGVAMELENSMLRPTVHDDRYDEVCLCETCVHKDECDYWYINCENYEED